LNWSIITRLWIMSRRRLTPWPNAAISNFLSLSWFLLQFSFPC
jgi:hypothetical protein